MWKTFKQEKAQIKTSKAQIKTSEESAQHQKVEDQFFKLLELYQKVVKDNQINVIHGQLKQKYNKEITGGYSSFIKPSDLFFSEYTASVCYETIFDEEQATAIEDQAEYFLTTDDKILKKYPT